MNIATLTPTQLRTAADLQEQIAKLKSQLAAIFDPGSGIPAPFKTTKAAKPAKRKMSAAHKAKIIAAQKLRWAKHYAAKAKTAPVAAKPLKKKFTMSAEAKAKISAAAKARWAAKKAGQGKK